MYTESAFLAVKDKFDQKRVRARNLIDSRREEIYTKIPRINELDEQIALTGASLVKIALSGGEDALEKTNLAKQKSQELIREKIALLEKAGYPRDYLENVYECSKCRDSGYVGGEMCDCMKSELISVSRQYADIAGALKNVTFDNINLNFYEGDALVQAEFVLEKCKKFAARFDSPDTKSLLIFGNTGVGKTYFSAATANHLIQKGYSVIYSSAHKLFSSLVDARFGHTSSDDYYSCDLIIIDDLGSELSNTATTACFFELLNARMLNGKKMIINTNLSFKDIETLYSARILSRFAEFERLALSGNDIRLLKAKS